MLARLAVFKLLCWATALVPAAAAAKPAVWRDESGRPVADSAERKSVGGFGAWLVATDKERATLTKWMTPSAKVYVDDVVKLERNKPLMVTVVFFGCAADQRGNCNVQVKFMGVQPDGKRYFAGPWEEAWVAKAAPPAGALEMSVSYVRMTIEARELLGNYTLHAHIADRNAKRELALSKTLRVVEAGTLKPRGKRR